MQFESELRHIMRGLIHSCCCCWLSEYRLKLHSQVPKMKQNY